MATHFRNMQGYMKKHRFYKLFNSFVTIKLEDYKSVKYILDKC